MIDDANVTAYHDAELLPALRAVIAAAGYKIDAAQFCAAPVTPTTGGAFRAFFDVLLAAPKRGIVARMALAAPSPKNPQGDASRRAAEQLAAAGWQIAWLPSWRLLHAKTWRIDSDIAIIGSHNLTDAALTRNREVSVLVRSRGLALKMDNYYEAMTTPWPK